MRIIRTLLVIVASGFAAHCADSGDEKGQNSKAAAPVAELPATGKDAPGSAPGSPSAASGSTGAATGTPQPASPSADATLNPDSAPATTAASSPSSTPTGPAPEGSVEVPLRENPAVRTLAQDFLVQDVCVDARDEPTADDPVACPASTRRRNLAPGEILRYAREDQTHTQRSLSFPSWNSGTKSFWYVATFDFGSSGVLTFEQFDDGTDGYDLIEADGPLVSIPQTRDPGGDHWFVTTDCRKEDGWLLFPSDIALGAANGRALAEIAGSEEPLQCPAGYTVAMNAYFYPNGPFRYTGGQVLESIITSHFDVDDLPKVQHMERMYFTKEYGKTRWESWDRNGKPDGLGCNGADTDPDLPGLVRTACRDWTFIKRADALQPLQWPILAGLSHGNLLENADFGRRNVDGWQRLPNTDWNAALPNAQSAHLALACANDPCASASLFQDVAVESRQRLAPDAEISFGGRFAASDAGQMTLVVFQLGANGAILAKETVAIEASQESRLVSSRVTVVNGALILRFQVYLLTPGVEFRVDDLWMARVQ